MNPTRKHILLSCLSGVVWGLIAVAIGFGAFPRAIWGGLIASPLIGLFIGAITLRWFRLPVYLRVAATLVSLYVAASLFGLAVGVYDWLALDIPDRIPHGVVVQAVLAVLWGLTFMGYFIVLWPLAYLNHWLLARTAAAGQS